MRYRALVAVLALASGCHRWVPLTESTPTSVTVELRLNEEGTAAATALVGPRTSRVLGALVDASGDSLRIAVSEVSTADGLTFFLQGSHIAFARAHLAEVRVREIDRRRTTVAIAVVTVGAIALVAAVRNAGFGEDNTIGGGGVTPALRIP